MPMPPRVSHGEFTRALVLENPDPTLDDHLRGIGIEPFRPSSTPNEDELIKLLEADPYELIYKRSRVEITPRVLDAAPNLSAVMLCCIGDDSVDKVACAQRGVLVTNDPVSNGRSVVELFTGEMICMARRVFEADRETNQNQFVKTQAQRFEVRGKTLGVFGLGNIGKQVAQVGELLGMKIAFYDNREVAREVGQTMGWDFAPTLADLFKTSDVVTAHISAFDYRGNSNDGVLKYEHFAAMGEKERPSPRLFLNLARGNILDPKDLTRAVDEGHIGQAMVDVYPEEPRQKSDPWVNPYAGHPRIFGTPHIGAATLEAQPRIASHVAGTTRLLSRYGRLRNCVFGGKEEVGIDSVDSVRRLPHRRALHRARHQEGRRRRDLQRRRQQHHERPPRLRTLRHRLRGRGHRQGAQRRPDPSADRTRRPSSLATPTRSERSARFERDALADEPLEMTKRA